MIRKLTVIFCVFVLLPWITGGIYTSRKDEDLEMVRPGRMYLNGLFTILAVFEVIAVPCSYLHTSLSTLQKIYLAALAFLAVISVFRNRLFVCQFRAFGPVFKRVTPMLLAAVLCIGMQAVYVTKMQHVDEDDALYLGIANTSVQTDTLYMKNPYTGKVAERNLDARYMLSAWPLFLAVVSVSSGMQVTVLAHMVLPAVVVLWVYLIYYMLALWFYPTDKQRASVFLFIVTILFTFSGFSIYSSSLFPLIRSWQGKAVMAGFALPALVYYTLCAMETDRMDRRKVTLFIAVAAVTVFSTIGAALAALSTGAVGLAAAIRRRKFMLLVHAAVCCLPAAAVSVIYLLYKYTQFLHRM